MWTAGTIGDWSKGISGSKSADLRATLGTIEANLGFDELQQMRANSPTGGALGAVSENENRLLQSTWANVQQSQSPSQLKANLTKLAKIKAESNQRVKAAYDADAKRFGQASIPGISMDELNRDYPAPQGSAMPPAMPPRLNLGEANFNAQKQGFTKEQLAEYERMRKVGR